MTAKTTTKPAAKPAAKPATRVATKAEAKAVQDAAIAKLVAAYREAAKQLAGKDAGVEDALNLLQAAKLGQCNARVLTARAAYRLATAPGIATKAYPVNQSGAAKALDVNRTTLRHHIKAGEALAKKKLVFRLGAPTEEERAVVENSHDKTSREIAAESRATKAKAAAAKEEAAEAKLEAVAKAAATGDVQAMAELMPGKSGDVVTVQAAESTSNPPAAETAPVPAESTAVTVAEILAKLDAVLAMVTGFTKQAAMTDTQRDAIETRLSGIATASYVEAE